ncbi:redoxin domain-containing protein [Neorhodopirellula lusitana]|uniref:redoxin domain-containing protein n=1 Tax=Neorhodopirellula lusitana TaxID=445327 RepID=UPI00384F2B07
MTRSPRIRTWPLALLTAFSCLLTPANSQAAQPFLLQMIRDDAVHQELQLTDSQIDQVYEAIAQVDPRWWISRITPAEKQQAEIQQLTDQLQTSLDELLNADQRLRLQQLVRQAHGTRMARSPGVAEALQLTTEQLADLETRFTETDTKVAAIQKQLAAKDTTPQAAAQEIAQAQQNERQGILETLTTEQQTAIGPLVGKSFNFSAIKRTYPRAPEFITEGATWIGESPVRMQDLRGKVVAVYFYAFQCINCQRNFPHYKSWHDDLADEGLVVIGIQTPETSAERDPKRVQEAYRSDEFQFPVLFDEASNNWRAWGNTMWPTTYLIDKQGFIRRWWQGEMNWQGTLGEQQMRESIQTLLAE